MSLRPTLAALLTLGATAALAEGPCCTITSIDARTGQVSARVNASGAQLDFRAPNPQALRVGQPIYANLQARKVSLDGRTACCTITSVTAAQTAQPRIAGTPALKSPAPVRPAAAAGAALAGAPVASFGAPHAPPQATTRRLALAGPKIMELRGEAAIENDRSLPEGARKLLLMHVRGLEPGEVRHYVINRELAEEWAKSHPVPASLDPHKKKKKKGCHAISMHCAKKAGEHAMEQVAHEARKDWKHVTGELARDWKMAQDCFADETLHVGRIPVRFDVTPQFSRDFQKDGKSKAGGGSGSVRGTVTVGVPVSGDFFARVDLFYIPCLPFAVRPKQLGADGTMQVGAKLGAHAVADGRFAKTFALGAKIPIEVVPIVIGGVPVAEVDVSVYLEGNVEVGGDGSLDGRFNFDAQQQAAFDFVCSGKGCKFRSHRVPGSPQTTREQAELKGRVHLKPALYAALQLDFDYDVLSARAGPQPYLWGEIHGCAYGSATQAGSASAAQEFHALTADLDWGLELRAEALGAGELLARPLVLEVLKPRLLWFKDLAPGGSNAIAAQVDGATKIAAGKRAAYRVKMRPCYPYEDKVQYRVAWNGTATPAAHPDCTWQGNGGVCWLHPVKGDELNLVWTKSGANTLSVTPLRDQHGRSFKASPTLVNVVAE